MVKKRNVNTYFFYVLCRYYLIRNKRWESKWLCVVLWLWLSRDLWPWMESSSQYRQVFYYYYMQGSKHTGEISLFLPKSFIKNLQQTFYKICSRNMWWRLLIKDTGKNNNVPCAPNLVTWFSKYTAFPK